MIAHVGCSRFLTLLFLFCCLTAFAQHPSLASKVNQAEGLAKAEAIYDAVVFHLRSDVDSAKFYVNEMDEYAEGKNDPLLDAYALLYKGLYLATIGQPDSALVLMEQGHLTATKKKYEPFLIRSGTNLGRIYISTGNPEKALSYLYKTLDLLAKNPHKEIELRVRVNIVWAYLELRRYKDCISSGRKGLAMITPETEYIVPYFCNNIASSYGALDNIDSARYFILKGLPIAEKNQDNSIAANALFIFGNICLYEGNADKAIEQFEKAKPYRQKAGNPFFIVSDLNTLSNLFYEKGDYKDGLKNGLAALEIAEKNGIILKFAGIYEALGQNYEGLKDFKNASKYFHLLAHSKDSLYQYATADAIAEMETKYEAEKKNLQIHELNKDNELKTATIERNYLLIGGLTLTLALAVVIFYLWRYRHNQKQQAVMQEQKIRLREMQINAVVDSQEQERKRFASDLHDGMGQLVSALQLNIQAIKQDKDLDKTVSRVENSEQLLSEIQSEIRNIAFNLMPPVLVKEGLILAVGELIRRLNKSGSLKIEFSVHDVPSRLSQVSEISVYRIIQELLSNIMKHSKATEVTVSFTGFEEELVLTLEDNGSGYDLNNFQNSERGNGWNTIQTRVNLIHAQIEFDTVQGRKNNTVILHIPTSVNKETSQTVLQNT